MYLSQLQLRLCYRLFDLMSALLWMYVFALLYPLFLILFDTFCNYP